MFSAFGVVSQAGLPHPSSALAPMPPLSASWEKRKGVPAVTGMSKSPSGLMHWPVNGRGAVADVYSVQTKELDVETLSFPTSFLLCIMSLKLPAPTQIISCHLT